VDELRTESLELQTTLQNKLNTINQEQIRNTEALRKSLQDLQKTLFESIEEFSPEDDPVTKIVKAREKAIKETQEQIKEFLGVAASLGLSEQETQATLAEFDKLLRLIDEKAREELSKERSINIAEIKLPSDLKVPVRLDVRPEITDPKSIEEDIEGVLEGLARLFNNKTFRAFQTVSNGITEALVSGINRQISELDKIGEQRQKQIQDLEDGLEEEQELRERGFAVNIDGKREELAQLQALQEADDKKKQELAAKAQRIQIINDSIQQASSLTSAAASVFKGFSTIPFIGVGLGVAAVVAMFAAFAKVKADALAATRLNKGSDRLYDDVGQIAPGEGSDVPGRGKPEFRIVDSKNNTRAVVGGEEMLIDGNTSQALKEVMGGHADKLIGALANNEETWEEGGRKFVRVKSK